MRTARTINDREMTMDQNDELKYLTGFKPEAPDLSDAIKPKDPGGDALPFNHISDRRFEVLVYLLKKREAKGKRVTLMVGVGERGRDVTVYTPAGVLEEIDQCKLYAGRLSLPDTCREILKLALHAFLDASALPSTTVTYELWCPGDFSAGAASLLDTWPNEWDKQKLDLYFEQLREEYKAFEKLEWSAVEAWVRKKFPNRIAPAKLNGVDISKRVHAAPEIYAQFFEGKLVLSAEDVTRFMEERFKSANFRQIAEEDERHILARVQSFDPKLRLYFGAYVLGLHPSLLSAMSRSEFERLVHVVGSAYDLIPVISPVLMRVVGERTAEADKRIKHKCPAFGFLLGHLAAVKGGLRTEFHVMAKMDPFLEQTDVSEFRGKTDAQIISRLAEAFWDSADQPISPSLEGEALATVQTMKFVAGKIREPYGASGKAQFVQDAKDDFDKNAADVYAFVKDYLLLVPTQLMTITDTTLPYEDEKLFEQLYGTLHKMTGK